MEPARRRGLHGRHFRHHCDPDQRAAHAEGLAPGADVQECAGCCEAGGDSERSGDSVASTADRASRRATANRSGTGQGDRAIPRPRRPPRACRGRSSTTSSASWRVADTTKARSMVSMVRGPTPRSATSSRPPVSSRARSRTRRCCRRSCARPQSLRRWRPRQPPRHARLRRSAAAVTEKPAPSKRVIALQRALADYGYGQIKPSGIVDASPGRDREIRARAQAARHWPAIRPGRARAFVDDPPAGWLVTRQLRAASSRRISVSACASNRNLGRGLCPAAIPKEPSRPCGIAAPEAGAIFVKLNRLDGTAELFGPAPQSAFDDAPGRPHVQPMLGRAARARREGRGAAGARGCGSIPMRGSSRSRSCRTPFPRSGRGGHRYPAFRS